MSGCIQCFLGEKVQALSPQFENIPFVGAKWSRYGRKCCRKLIVQSQQANLPGQFWKTHWRKTGCTPPSGTRFPWVKSRLSEVDTPLAGGAGATSAGHPIDSAWRRRVARTETPLRRSQEKLTNLQSGQKSGLLDYNSRPRPSWLPRIRQTYRPAKSLSGLAWAYH